jgi:hypothetical protein
MRHKQIQMQVLVLLMLVSIHVGCSGTRGVGLQEKTARPIAYEILEDDMGTRITIGVDSEITEDQLKATLAKAATDHQNDPARDYLVSERLWVDAYLIKQGKRSTVPAGTLGRYVPPRNPEAKKNEKVANTDDELRIRLEEARRGLN